jgi:hypothetical protein
MGAVYELQQILLEERNVGHADKEIGNPKYCSLIKK